MNRKVSVRGINDEIRPEFTMLLKSYKDLEKQVEHQETQKQEIIKNAIKEIDADIEKLKSKMSKLWKAMDALHPQKTEAYDINGTWKEKIIWVLKNTDSLIPVSTIIGKIRMNENDFTDSLASTIRLTARRMAAKGEVIEYDDPNIGKSHYALPEWFKEDGTLKEVYYF